MAGSTAFDWAACEDPAEMVQLLLDASERKKRLALDAYRDIAFEPDGPDYLRGDYFENRFSCDCSHCVSPERKQIRADILREIFPPPHSKQCPKCGGKVSPDLLGHDLENHACCADMTCGFISNMTWAYWIKYPFPDEWRTPTVIGLARQIDDTGDFSALPILADALEEAGCEDEAILDHCRSNGKCSNCAGKGWTVPKSTEYYLMRADPLVFRGVQCQQCGGGGNEKRVDHLRGCWVIDLIFGRE